MRGCYFTMGLLVLLCGCGGRRQSVEGLTAADIASIEVFYGNLPDDQPDVGPFTAAPEDFDRLLGLLRGGVRSQHPAGWQGLAWFKIRTRTGEEVVAYLYQTHSSRGAYNVGGTYYRGGSDEAFIHALLECRKHAQAKGRAEQP